MSAVLATPEREPQEIVRNLDGFAVVSWRVDTIRGLGLGVIRHPEDEEPDHVKITGGKPKETRRLLRGSADWAWRPADWDDVHLPRYP